MGIEWRGWTRLPGTTDAAPCAYWDGHHVHLYCKGINDKRIYHMTFTRSGIQTAWQEVGLGFKTTAGVSVATGTPVCALDAFRRVQTLDNGAWNVVAGGGTTDVSPNVLPVGQALALFCRGIDDDSVYVNLFQSTVGNWPGWSEVPGDGRTKKSLTSLVTSDYHVELFAVGTGGGAFSTFAQVEWLDDAIALRWFGMWFEIPGNLLMHLAMCAAGKDPRNTYGADTQSPSWNRTYLVATNPQGMVMYNAREEVDRVLPPGQSPWQGWTKVPEQFELGDFITDVAPAAVISYGGNVGPPYHNLDVLFIFGKLAADNTIWMNVGLIRD